MSPSRASCSPVVRWSTSAMPQALTPLHWAATVDAGTNELAKLLLAAGADRQVKSTAGDTPLALARRHHNRAVEQLLLQ
jgi:ankyrin repeat protein